MRILPINNYQKQPSYKAINQKYLKMAIEEATRWKHPCLGHLITSIGLAVLYGQMSKEDAIDTLEAIKPYDKYAIDAIDGTIKALKKGKTNQ